MTGRSQRGSMTVMVAATVAVVVMALSGLVVLVDVAATVHRAAATADLAALAAAHARVSGDPGPCSSGEAVTGANGAWLRSCQLHEDDSVAVVVQVPIPVGRATAVLTGAGSVTARSRAGPAP